MLARIGLRLASPGLSFLEGFGEHMLLLGRSFAWLFLPGPMPGGARVTVHVLGDSIRAAAGGAFLVALPGLVEGFDKIVIEIVGLGVDQELAQVALR